MGHEAATLVAKVVRLILGIFCLFLTLPVLAKDYFGITLDQDNAATVCQKASKVLADCDILANGDAQIQGNGLLRLINPVIQQANIGFSTVTGAANKLVVLTRPLSNASVDKLVKHLREDYDLADLTSLNVQGLVDIRGKHWDIQPLCQSNQPCRYQVTISN
jgi:hypothetical protein